MPIIFDVTIKRTEEYVYTVQVIADCEEDAIEQTEILVDSDFYNNQLERGYHSCSEEVTAVISKEIIVSSSDPDRIAFQAIKDALPWSIELSVASPLWHSLYTTHYSTQITPLTSPYKRQEASWQEDELSVV